MLGPDLNVMADGRNQRSRFHYDSGVLATEMAWRLHRRARFQAKVGRLWAALTRRSWRLLDLGAVEHDGAVGSRRYAGARAVPISGIRGSLNRTRDFDAAFRPLQEHTRGRWLRIARAKLAGYGMPAVELVQVGDDYYVQDGHHRISVARAMGEVEIDAVVTIWQVAGDAAAERVPAEQIALPEPA